MNQKRNSNASITSNHLPSKSRSGNRSKLIGNIKDRKGMRSSLNNGDNNSNLFKEESSSFRPLRQLFNVFSKIKGEERDSMGTRATSKKSGSNEEDGEKDDAKITLFGLEAWFKTAEVFATPVCKITVSDLRTIFARGEKPGITYKEFENFVESLCQFRKVHPSTILLRLQMAGSKHLQEKVFQTTAPEGTVDRIVDAFILEADNVSERFIDLSSEPYEEPICFGGVRASGRRARSPNSKREEEKDLTAKAMGLMAKGVDAASEEDPLMKNFIYFAKNGNYYSDGRSMELTQLIKWMKQAGVIDGTNITSMDIGYLFKRLYSLNWCIYVDDLNQFLYELSLWKNADGSRLINQLRTCGPPASASVSVISMSLPAPMVEILKNTLNQFSEDFEDKRDQFEPTLADTPFGHTPNSRNRHFRNAIDEDINKAKSSFLDDLKKGKNGDAAVLINNSPDAKNPLDKDDTNEVFSEEKRSGKDYLTKRWNDAYPIGGIETSHRGRIEADLEKMLFGVDRADDSSSDDEDRAKNSILKAKLIMTTVIPPTTIVNPAIPFEDQFDKFKKFGEFANEDGVTIQNIELWFTLSGLLVPHGATVFNTKEINENFHQFKFVQENGYLDYDSFVKFLEQLGEMKGKHTNAKELKDRLSRCGAPRIPQSREDSLRSSSTQGPKISSAIKQHSTASRVAFDDLDDPTVSPQFKARFLEYARFGEATVPAGTTPYGISMLNSDKWFKQAKLQDKGMNLGDVDVMYKQLFPTKQRITIKDFIKLVDAMRQTNKRQQMPLEELIAVLEDAGQPAISAISEIRSTHPSKTKL